MVSLSVMPMTNYPATHMHMKLYSPVRREMTAVAAFNKHAEKAVSASANEHWNYCHKMLPKVSKSFVNIVLQISQPELRDSICNMHLLLRNLDTIEDDMVIPDEVKIPTLYNFHRCLDENDWKFVCGTDAADRELTKGHHHIQAAFMDLESSCQEVIREVVKEMSQGMSRYIPKEIETMRDYEEYSNYVHGIFISGTLRMAHALIGEDLAEDSLSRSMAFLHQDFQDEVNSVKAVQLLNEMITNALSHAEDCLDFMCKIQDPLFLRFYAVPRIASIGELALCYNNLQVFRTAVKPQSPVIYKLIC